MYSVLTLNDLNVERLERFMLLPACLHFCIQTQY